MNKYIVHRSETPYMANPLPLYIFFSTPPPPKKKKYWSNVLRDIYKNKLMKKITSSCLEDYNTKLPT